MDDDIRSQDFFEGGNLEDSYTFLQSPSLESSPSPSALDKRARRRQKIDHNWTEEEIIKLISKVESCPSIWDASSNDHKLKTNREKCWQAIANSFGNKIPLQQMVAKWGNLRTQFRRLSNAKTKSGQEAVKSVHWKYYQYLKFISIAEEQQTVNTTSNLNVVSTLKHQRGIDL